MSRTVAAIATASGLGALGVIRISGDKAIEIADKVFFPFSGKKLAELKGYTAAYGEVKDGDTVLDDGVALVFRAPHSYTGEDTVEISLHGGAIILRDTLRLIFSSGAFSAEGGEFTKRAFLNGKTDLTRAESIMGLISAESDAQLRLSRAAHLGKTAEKLDKIIQSLTKADAAISVFSDYPDEDIEGLDRESFSKMLENAKKSLEIMLREYDAGKILREGVDTAIVGKPNVGKSSLMNMLSGAERSIVTDIAGTTRDVIEETVRVGDIVLRLADTAGIRDTGDTIESIGVNLARKRIDSAQLILAVFDASNPLSDEDLKLLASLKGKNVLIIINKTDLGSQLEREIFRDFKVVEISAKENKGTNELSQKINEICGTFGLSPDSAVLINERQRACAARALKAVREAYTAIMIGQTLDAVGICLDDALSALFELTGKRVTNEVADEIFKSFCVGK
ncbi:MAG: tRNA uridine-5-carboxymethylaminomethyl(34) synthesis GTPase MnmE [Clostridia bacterium]|nr:tRNA uridine-5-carboxymethylaminomethyl(34) synthesis GTPase MnmE [Clostridia bacterium]